MTELLEKLSAGELDALAGEIVRNLDGAAHGDPAALPPVSAPELLHAVYGGGDTAVQTAVQRLLVQAAAALVPMTDAEGAETSEASAPLQTGSSVSAPETARGAMDVRFEETPLQTAGEMSAAAFPRHVSGRRQDIAALSEYFRRDSRRYDVGFERF